MKTRENYYNNIDMDPLRFDNIEEKQLIHQFTYKTMDLDLNKMKDKKKINELR